MKQYYELIFQVKENGQTQAVALYQASDRALSKEDIKTRAHQFMAANTNSYIEFISYFEIDRQHYESVSNATKMDID